MRIVRQLAMVFVAVCAFCAVAVASASAAEPLFLFHGTGGKLLGSASTTQHLVAGGHVVDCTALTVTQGTAIPLRFLAILARVQYSSCKAEGLFTATVHPVHYIIFANGLVRVASDISILVPEAACTLNIPAAKNQSLPNAVLFDNNPVTRGILLLVHASGIFATGSGAGCEFTDPAATNTGTIHIIAHGGLLKWDANA
jgi:hypothetical protein